MKILALERELSGVPGDTFTDDVLREEAAAAWHLHRLGVIRELYFRSDRHTAVLLLECAGVDEANEILATLPLVKQGLIEFQTIPLEAYTGFERLFENSR
jgi:muconolactone delta-isomerase